MLDSSCVTSFITIAVAPPVELVTEARIFMNGKENSEDKTSSIGPMQNKIATSIPNPRTSFRMTEDIIALGITTAASLISSASTISVKDRQYTRAS